MVPAPRDPVESSKHSFERAALGGGAAHAATCERAREQRVQPPQRDANAGSRGRKEGRKERLQHTTTGGTQHTAPSHHRTIAPSHHRTLLTISSSNALHTSSPPGNVRDSSSLTASALPRPACWKLGMGGSRAARSAMMQDSSSIGRTLVGGRRSHPAFISRTASTASVPNKRRVYEDRKGG